eukprot:4551330-Prymnesium_polylepis.1
MIASVNPQKRRGASRYPKGKRDAHMSFPVPGCRTTNIFLLSSAMGICQKPSRMSYLANLDDGFT